MARASAASMTIGATMPIAPQSSTILIHSCFPAGTRASGTQPASAMAPNIIAAVWMSVWVCSMSTVSQGNPVRAMNRAAATLPRDSHVPICGLPACNARMTGFFFNVDPRFQSGRRGFPTIANDVQAGSNRWQFPRITVRPAEHPGCLIIAHDLLGPGVPAQALAAQPHGDIAQVADGNRPVGDLDRRRGRPARDHAVDEIAEVIVALVEVDLSGADLGIEDGFRVGRVLAAVRVDRPLGALEGDPHAISVGDAHGHAVFVDGLEVKVGRGVPEPIRGKIALDVAELDRAGQLGTDAPLGTVGVMPAPVGDLAAGIVEDPAEVDVAPRGGVGSGGRRAKPGVVFKRVQSVSLQKRRFTQLTARVGDLEDSLGGVLDVRARCWSLLTSSWHEKNRSISLLHRCAPHRRGSEYAPWMVNLTSGRRPVHPPRNRCWRKLDRRSRKWSASALGKNGRFGNSRNGCWYSCSAWAVC